jgi:NAD(P)H dehydrogenase (quinone)
MVQIFIVYENGPDNHEKKMAEYVAEGAREVSDVEVVIKQIDEAKIPELAKGDGLIVGGPNRGDLMSWRMKKFLDDFVAYGYIMTNKVGGVFCCTQPGSEEEMINSMMVVMAMYKMIIVGPDYKYGRAGAFSYGEPKSEWEQGLCRGLGRKVAKVAKIVSLHKDLLQGGK